MFRRLHEVEKPCRVVVDGQPVAAAPGDTVATALLLAGIGPFRRTMRSGTPRAAYCGMGVCFECLVAIDGVGNRQACLEPVRDGMVIVTGGQGRHLKDEDLP
ncbi:(2Fe-2S)-binding protein [Methylobacterium sp. NFXW15]|uniref:(2Fe-2S)-binding protein n=1 Tax=Methylobacterium sp. NFXW15 TaxID=2819512 RepID=UPI003CFA3D5D